MLGELFTSGLTTRQWLMKTCPPATDLPTSTHDGVPTCPLRNAGHPNVAVGDPAFGGHSNDHRLERICFVSPDGGFDWHSPTVWASSHPIASRRARILRRAVAPQTSWPGRLARFIRDIAVGVFASLTPRLRSCRSASAGGGVLRPNCWALSDRSYFVRCRPQRVTNEYCFNNYAEATIVRYCRLIQSSKTMRSSAWLSPDPRTGLAASVWNRW
jgi:hypothetical protein